jgi:hypothetical protein
VKGVGFTAVVVCESGSLWDWRVKVEVEVLVVVGTTPMGL